jgi:hypothetical protein
LREVRRYLDNYEQSRDKRKTKSLKTVYYQFALYGAIENFIQGKHSLAEFEERIKSLGADDTTFQALLQTILEGRLHLTPKNGARPRPQSKPISNENGNHRASPVDDIPLWQKFGWVKHSVDPLTDVYVGEYKTAHGKKAYLGEIIETKPLSRLGKPTFKTYIKDPPDELKNHPKRICWPSKRGGLHFINITNQEQMKTVDNVITGVIADLDRCFTSWKVG